MDNKFNKNQNNDKYKFIVNGDFINEETINGKGKEYNEYNELLYEGEYINGKRDGKGKEYGQNNKIIFEGEYKDGERNGKGKEYNDKDAIIFEVFKWDKKWKRKRMF